MKDPIAHLATQIASSSLRQTALKLGISAPYLSDIMRGNRTMGPKILAAMGIEKVEDAKRTTYRKARTGA